MLKRIDKHSAKFYPKSNRQKSIRYYFSLIKSKWISLVVFSLSGIIIGIIGSLLLFPKEYSATGYFGVNKGVHESVYRTTVSIVLSDNTSVDVYNYLVNKEKKHENGSNITYDEIKNGLFCEYTYSMQRLPVKFTNRDKTIVNDVLNATMDIVMKHVHKEDIYHIANYIFLDEYSTVINNEPNRKPIFVLSSVLVSLMLYLSYLIVYTLTFKKIQFAEELTFYGNVLLISSNEFLSNLKLMESFIDSTYCSNLYEISNIKILNLTLEHKFSESFQESISSIYDFDKNESMSEINLEEINTCMNKKLGSSICIIMKTNELSLFRFSKIATSLKKNYLPVKNIILLRDDNES